MIGYIAPYQAKRWSLAALLIQLLTSSPSFTTASTSSLDKALLTDLLQEYISHEPSTCSPATAANTTFTFTFPGTNPDSQWDPTSATFESSLFAAMMSHVDSTSGKSWDIRIGTSGNIYSHYVGDTYGETMPPQTYSMGQGRGWTDEVPQMVSVNLGLNKKTEYPQYCTEDETASCEPHYYVHQAGAYQRDSPYTDTSPVYSPSLAKYCAGHSCMFASWGTQAHVPTAFISPIMYITKFTNCGDGVIEHTQMIHNFANPLTSKALEVDHDYFNVIWGGVRSSNLPYALEPGSNTLDYGSATDINNVDYKDLCSWSDGGTDITNIDQLGGYTTFVGDGLIVNRTLEIELPCRKPDGEMVSSCTEAEEYSGYTRLPFGVPSQGPKCAFHNSANPYADYVPLTCNFKLDKNFGQTNAYTTDLDPCVPWSEARIGFYNTVSKATLEVSYVRHWSNTIENYRTYFSVFIKDTGSEARNEAVALVDNMFAGGNIPMEVRPVYLSSVKPYCAIPEGCDAATAATCMVPKCNEGMIASGYSRIELGVLPGGPNCQVDPAEVVGDLVPLACDLRTSTGFGEAVANLNTPIGLYNMVNGQTLPVAFLKAWSLDVTDRKVYLSVAGYPNDPTAAIAYINSMFANTGTSIMPIEIRSTVSTTAVPDSYDPASLPAFTYVYGKGEDYSSGVAGYGRRRLGSTTSDFTVFTVNWMGGKLSAGESYQNRQFMFSGPLGSAETTAEDLSPKVYIDTIGAGDWSPRTVNIFQSGQDFSAIAASSAQGTIASCGALSPLCSGKSTPSQGLVPYFNIECGQSSYLGPNPYHFTTSSFPNHGGQFCVRATTGTASYNDGNIQILVDTGGGFYSVANGFFSKGSKVLDSCFSDIVAVQVKGTTNNAWVGQILVSSDGRKTFSSALTCADCGGDSSSNKIVVEADNDGTGLAPTQCQNGKTCTMPFQKPICLRIVTSTTHGRDGRMRVSVNSGTGYYVVANHFWNKGTTWDECYTNIVGVQIQGPTPNSWGGSIYISKDGGGNYAPLHCSNCDGSTTDTTSMYVDGDANQGWYGTTWCVNGAVCDLPLPKICVKAITGTATGNDGGVDLLVNTGNGKGYFQITPAGSFWGLGEVVIDHCYIDLVGVQVRGHANNAWTGSILVSTDNKATYSPLPCYDCGGAMTSESVIVEADNNGAGQAPTQCQNGDTCTMSLTSCLLVETGTGQYDNGYLEVFVDSGNGYVSVAGHSLYGTGSTVVDQCFPDIIKVQVETRNNNAWIGSIKLSKDNKVTYSTLTCEDCTGTSSSTSKIVLDGDGDAAGLADTHCFGRSSPCTIPAVNVPEPENTNVVRAYACEGEDSSARPSLKLLGFFDPNNCPENKTLTYDPSMCDSFEPV